MPAAAGGVWRKLAVVRTILQQPGLRFIFIANLVSMLGSGMNSAAVTWYILQETRSEMALGTLVVLQTIPAMLMLPFTGVIIDREDRRRLVMLLDAARGLIILAVAFLAWRGSVQLWQIYLMNTLVAAGFWMFWPTITALIQELTPDAEFVHANTFLLAGVQGGWLIAGAIVGFIYNTVGLAGVLFIDFGTYIVSFCCYLLVRKGRVVVGRPPSPEDGTAPEGAVARFFHEMKEGLAYLRVRPHVILIGTSWAVFIGAMLSQGVITAPLSDRILHAGAVGYGWLNGGWGMGAFITSFAAPFVIRRLGAKPASALAMAVMAVCLTTLPFFTSLALAVGFYLLMGAARAVGGISLTSSMMEVTPKHFMGRVQNTFYFFGTLLQLVLGFAVGWLGHHKGLVWSFALIGAAYGLAFITAMWPARSEERVATPAG